MVNRRGLDAEHPAYDPGTCSADGFAQCRRCLGEVRQPGRMFCSAACEHEFRIRVSPAYARAAVYRRDRGVCTHCSIDCGMLDRIIARLRQFDAIAAENDSAHELAPQESVDDQQKPAEGEQTALWLIAAVGLGTRKRITSMWQADHRVAFSTGGADCGLGNLRTLCLACHQVQTKDLHRRGKLARQA